MKKRLLSAALALAMVLTMLPMSVFAAYTYDNPTPEGNGTESVSYVQYPNSSYTYLPKDSVTFPGWFVTLNVPAEKDQDGKPIADKPAKTVYYQVTDGVIVSGRYYNTTNYSKAEYIKDADGKDTTTPIGIYNLSKDTTTGDVTKTGLKGTVTVIGGTGITIDAVNASSLSVDVCGGTVTIKQELTGTNLTATNPTKLTSLTVTNSQYANTKAKGTITLDSSLDRLTSLSLTNTKAGAITLNAKTISTTATNGGGLAHSLTLNNAEVGIITLDGVGTNTAKTRAAQTVNITNSTVGDITVKGVNSTVTLNEVKGTTAPAVSIEGTGGNLYVRGGSVLGAVTITGDTDSDKAQTTAPSNVTVETGSTVASINNAGVNTKEMAAGRNTVSISGTVGGAVNLKNAAVTVNGGQTGALTVETGTVTVSGNRASVGDVTLAKDATFTLSGTNCTVGALAVAATGSTPATVTFNVPNDPSNTLGNTTTSVGSTYTKQTIKGGTWKVAVPAVNLDSSLVYQLKGGSTGPFTYYTSDQLGEAIIKQGSTADSVLTKIGVTGTQVITFMNGSTKWGELTVAPGTTIPKLPEQMNSVKTPYWSDGEFSNLAGLYNTPNPAGGSTAVTLNAGGGAVTGEVTELTDVEIDGAASDIKAVLAGNVITLSGAITSTDTKYTLTLETDAVDEDNKPVTIEVGVSLDPSTKTLTFVNPGSMSLGNGVIIENTFAAIKLSNGTRYTLNGQNLVVRSQGIAVKGIDTKTYDEDKAISKNDIEVIVTASGYTANDTLKKQIIDLINGDDAEFDWSDSPAVKQAVNAALATINDTTVQGYINAATSRARSDNRLSSNADTAYQTTGTQVWLVPYLEVNVTSYQPNPVNPALNATLTIKWRVEVHPGKVAADTPAVKEAANVANAAGTYIAKQGVALTLDSDLGDDGVAITFDSGVTNATFAHQESTYDYKIDANKITLTHAVNGNLGRIVLDTKAPLIQVGTKKTDNTLDTSAAVTYFSTLQAAVDAAEEGQLVEISSSYTGSTTINMTGKARTIYVQANGKNVVVANASGGLVEENSKGTFYTIKLNRDNTVTANAVVSVSSAGNGTAAVDTTIAKPGATVSGTYTANSGYKAGTFTATAQPGNTSVTVSVSANGTFSFTVPSGATSVTVTPSFVLDTGLPFTDVAANAWYFEGVKYCYDTMKGSNRLMQGFSSTTFGVNRPFTRAEVVTILWNMKSRPNPGTATRTYTDVGTNHWAYDAIIWATNNGYADGYSSGDGVPNGVFRPDQNVSRQEMATFLWKAANKPTVNISLAGYNDGYRVSDWAEPAMKWAVSNGILSGQSSVALNGTLAPLSIAYRSEVAVTVMQFDKLRLF